MGGVRPNITKHRGEVDRGTRRKALGQKGALVWLTGLSGSGKSTVAFRAERALVERRRATYVLDGDNVRHGLNRDLDFSAEARAENIRRIGEVAKLFVDAEIIVLAAFISPYREDRARVRSLLEPGEFVETYVNAPLSVCEGRDPKGLYRKARAGEVGQFTGISAPYEAPEHPEINLPTDSMDVDACAAEIVAYLEQSGFLAGG